MNLNRWLRAFSTAPSKTVLKGGSGFADISECVLHKCRDIPLVIASKETLGHYGDIIEHESDLKTFMKNTKWPKPDGWRKISDGTGDEQLSRIGTFRHYWQGNICHADNEAVQRKYKIGIESKISNTSKRSVLVRELNYHPCGSQCIFPRSAHPFIALLGAVPSGAHPDDLSFDNIRAFYFSGKHGLHIPAGVWHQPVFAVQEAVECIDMQSSVHACVVIDSIEEWGFAMNVPLEL